MRTHLIAIRTTTNTCTRFFFIYSLWTNRNTTLLTIATSHQFSPFIAFINVLIVRSNCIKKANHFKWPILNGFVSSSNISCTVETVATLQVPSDRLKWSREKWDKREHEENSKETSKIWKYDVFHDFSYGLHT